MTKCANVWFLNTTNDGTTNIAKYCEREHVIAIGFSLNPKDVSDSKRKELETERQNIKTIDDYWALLEAHSELKQAYKVEGDRSTWDGRKSIHQVSKLVGEYKKDDEQSLRKDDLVWMRMDGYYYLTRIKEDPKELYAFNASDKATQLDRCNQLKNCDWYRVGDESDIPGTITTRRQGTLCPVRTGSECAKRFSGVIYNALMDEHGIENCEPYEFDPLETSVDNFYSLLGPDDVEDLLAFWLHDQEDRYLPILSTNKKGTNAYEFVLLSLKDGHHCMPQVKNDSKLTKEAIKKLLDPERRNEAGTKSTEICLFVTGMPKADIEAAVDDYEKGASKNLKVYGSEVAEELYEWAKGIHRGNVKKDARVKHLPPCTEFWLTWLDEQATQS